LSAPQELFVAFALNLDQVRHLHNFVDVAEDLADARFAVPCALRLRVTGGFALVAMEE
jgi:hypothetical protein